MHHPFYKTIKGRFLIIILILMLVIGVGAATFSFIYYYNSLRTSTIQSTETNLKFLEENIDHKMEKIFSFSRWCQTNTDIVRYVMTDPDQDGASAAVSTAKTQLSEEYVYNDSSSYIQRVVIANQERSDYIQYVDVYYSIDRPMVQMIKELPYYQEYLDASTFLFPNGFQKVPFLRVDAEMLPILRPIFHPYNTSCVGFVYIEISPSLFTDSLKEYTKQEEVSVYLTIGDTSYRLKGNNYYPAFSLETVEAEEYSELVDSDTLIRYIEADGTQQLMVSRPLGATGCYLSQIISLSPMTRQLNGYLSLLVFIILCVTLVGILLYYALTRMFTNPIRNLSQRLQTIAQGDFTRDVSIEWDNELGDMGKNVNQLAADIDQLLKQRVETERQKKDYEYQILQSQIKPHFLYNTLNSIKWMATIQHAPGIAEMTTALSHLLKSIAKGTSTMISIRDEIVLLNDYFTIQKYRYGGSITLDYRIEDEAILENQILRFTMQPIVENAIFHGIEPKGQAGAIDVHMYYTDQGDVRIDITDDGIGMDEETIARVLQEETPNSSHFFKDIGISSVSKRLQYNFGEQYGLSIESVPKEYTKMSILLPNTGDTGKEHEL